MKNLNRFLLIFYLFSYSIVTAQWEIKTSGTTTNLSSVHFPSASIGFVVGGQGTILKSVNAGDTWNTIYLNPNYTFQSVFFINESIGFVVGNSIMLKTLDSGNSWNSVNLPIQTNIRSIKFITDQIGFFIGLDGIFKTIDGGNNWSLKSSTGGSSINFPTQTTGYAFTNSLTLLKTTNAGESWNIINSVLNSSGSATSGLFFTNENKGFFGGWYY